MPAAASDPAAQPSDMTSSSPTASVAAAKALAGRDPGNQHQADASCRQAQADLDDLTPSSSHLSSPAQEPDTSPTAHRELHDRALAIALTPQAGDGQALGKAAAAAAAAKDITSAAEDGVTALDDSGPASAPAASASPSEDAWQDHDDDSQDHAIADGDDLGAALCVCMRGMRGGCWCMSMRLGPTASGFAMLTAHGAQYQHITQYQRCTIPAAEHLEGTSVPQGGQAASRQPEPTSGYQRVGDGGDGNGVDEHGTDEDEEEDEDDVLEDEQYGRCCHAAAETFGFRPAVGSDVPCAALLHPACTRQTPATDQQLTNSLVLVPAGLS